MSLLRRLTGTRGVAMILVLLCLLLSVVTIEERAATGPAAGRALAERCVRHGLGGGVLVVADASAEDREFVQAFVAALEPGRVLRTAYGDPRVVRGIIEELVESGVVPSGIVVSATADAREMLTRRPSFQPEWNDVPLLVPEAETVSTFLSRANLLNVAETIAVWAILGIGMTLVIMTAGIDLCVGSLVALASVLASMLVRDVFGGVDASAFGVALAGLMAVLACGLIGLFNGLVVTRFGVAPFIATLAMLMAASGLALRLTNGASIDEVPDSFGALGHGSLLGVPVAVWLMLALYGIAHVAMTATTFGRSVIAVGANPEAARLAGVPVQRVLLAVYAISGLCAGIGGVLTASTFESGDPNYGQTYELYVIAGVVLGGTSLAGGQGTIVGTLLGALTLGVIYNGMNLTGVGGFSQRIVLGLVILLAVILDRMKRKR